MKTQQPAKKPLAFQQDTRGFPLSSKRAGTSFAKGTCDHMPNYKPEGALLTTSENQAFLKSQKSLADAMQRETVLEARAAVCDSSHNLIVPLGPMKGLIPREECALGIPDGTTRDIAIISRVGKPVCFVVTGFGEDEQGQPVAMLSRRRVQEKCFAQLMETLRPGDVIPAKVTHLENFGCFVDIGCGIVSLIPIDVISVSRISHPRDRFALGQDIFAVVKSVEGGRIYLSHKELLGTWEENAALFAPGETVAGAVRSVEDYGVFVELTPNLAGLAEPHPGVRPGQQASVFIKSLIPEKMKVKLIIVDAFDSTAAPAPLRYFLPGSHIDEFLYSPPQCTKVIKTRFSAT